MLLNRATLDGIQDGGITLVFRRWRKPTVRAGGRLRTAIGELAIGAVDIVEPTSVDDRQAAAAGFPSAGALMHELFRERRAQGSGRGRTAQVDASSRLYRIEVAVAGPDTRQVLREQLLDPEELAAMLQRLAAMDRRSPGGPWTSGTLDLIATWPARRAPELAELAGAETLPWKARVRRLKELGLTESLPVGYRLSPRGTQVHGARSAPPG